MLSPALRVVHEQNRSSWNAATVAHNSHKGNQIKFFTEGSTTLFPEEQELLGDLRGRTLLHLQCNCGQDSLSLQMLGAHVTGVDICDQAIDFARALALRTEIPVTFHRADLYDWLAENQRGGEAFDVVFSSYGAISWLSDLELWAELIAGVLLPRGRLVLVDYHPLMHMFDERGRLCYPYSSQGQPRQDERGVTDYVGISRDGLVPWGYQEGIRNFRNPYPDQIFHWGLADIVGAVLKAGLRVDRLCEYPYANGYRFFADGRSRNGRQMLPPPNFPDMPMMFGLVAAGA